jgi:hypothetical protein
MPGIRGRSLSASGSLPAAVSGARWTGHHETPYAAAASVAARPDSMTAETSVFCRRRVERARRGTSVVASKNVLRGHSGSSQKNRRLNQITSTGPATGMSRIRCRRRECRRVPMTPQAGQPDSVVLSTWILRWPKPGISVSTRWSGRLKIAVAASGHGEVSPVKARSPVIDECVENIHHNRATGPSACKTRNPIHHQPGRDSLTLVKPFLALDGRQAECTVTCVLRVTDGASAR